MKLPIRLYANACEVTRQAIEKRIKAGTLGFLIKNGHKYIDTTMYPPCKRKAGRKKLTAIDTQ